MLFHLDGASLAAESRCLPGSHCALVVSPRHARAAHQFVPVLCAASDIMRESFPISPCRAVTVGRPHIEACQFVGPGRMFNPWSGAEYQQTSNRVLAQTRPFKRRISSRRIPLGATIPPLITTRSPIAGAFLLWGTRDPEIAVKRLCRGSCTFLVQDRRALPLESAAF
ncbi:hypothetical protein VUR80DRAFT_6677 [Thermomyces stellatus]